MKHLMISGGPHETGLQHGRGAPELVAAAMQSEEYFAYSNGRPELRAAARRYEGNIAAMYPDLIDELHGIAEGAGAEYEDLLVYNLYCELRNLARESCSYVAIQTDAHGPMIGKLHDDMPDLYCLQTRAMPGRHTVFIATYAGTTWAMGGINDGGLCYCEASAPDGGHRDEGGVPGVMTLRRVLEMCATVDEAVGFLAAHGFIRWGRNICLADAGGGLLVVEKHAGIQGIREPEDGIIAATNFRNHPEVARSADTPTIEQYDQAGARKGAMDRYLYLMGAARRLGRAATIEQMQEVIQYSGQPGGVCSDHTVYGAVLLPAEGRVLLTDGPPSRNPFVEYRPVMA